MTITIDRLLATNRNPYEIQLRTGKRLSEIRQAILEEDDPLQGWGRLSLQPYIISRRRAGAPSWPPEHAPLLIEHKTLHDQGKTFMCQGRDGDWIIQYSIPARKKPKPQPYFYGE